MLTAQGLLEPFPTAPTKADILTAIRRMGVLQIDTIHVVARSPYFVLWSRLGDYRPVWLDELLAEGALFEYWAHAMCFLPIEDYPLIRRRMLDAVEEKAWPIEWAVKWSRENPEIVERVRSHLRENGSVRSAEFENKNRPPGGWWNWKDEKNALEALLFTGEVMIARRHNFQRVYDLRERVLPGWDGAAIPTSEEFQRTLTLRAVRALGVALPEWIPDYFRQPKKGMQERLSALAADGLLGQVEMEGDKGSAYVHPDRLALLDEIATGSREPTLTTLLSPFDPLVWDRQRARDLFDFDYRIECYTPAPKRLYGYFSLPILHRGALIGRLDAKAHRKDGVFEVKALYLEPGYQPNEQTVTEVASALRRCAAWHGTPQVVIRRSDPEEFGEAVEARGVS